MQGNPVSYRNLHRHLVEILNYLEITLDSDFVLEEMNSALIESEKTFGKRHPLSSQIRNLLKKLYNEYIEKKELPLNEKDTKRVRENIIEWLKKYYKKPPM
ncbi:MAG TPA: hypothetical protein VMX55_00870 [candidate division Zixibacteria bacterium]|nr:hypothetical protein [candidate division Zixibacteria bacterium]